MEVGQAKVESYQGDITELEVDAIVNAANNHLWMGGGVAGAIKRKGGKAVEDEAVKQGPIPVGEAVVTTAGKLKAKYVIHAAAMGQNLKTDEAKIREATRNSLRRAEDKRAGSIAFPAIGTGVGGFPTQLCAKAMIEEVADFLQASAKVKRVIFALFDRQTYDAFKKELAEKTANLDKD